MYFKSRPFFHIVPRFSPPETNKLSSTGLVFALIYCSKAPSMIYILYFLNSVYKHQIRRVSDM